jgi:hypothetical protein
MCGGSFVVDWLPRHSSRIERWQGTTGRSEAHTRTRGPAHPSHSGRRHFQPEILASKRPRTGGQRGPSATRRLHLEIMDEWHLAEHLTDDAVPSRLSPSTCPMFAVGGPPPSLEGGAACFYAFHLPAKGLASACSRRSGCKVSRNRRRQYRRRRVGTAFGRHCATVRLSAGAQTCACLRTTSLRRTLLSKLAAAAAPRYR